MEKKCPSPREYTGVMRCSQSRWESQPLCKQKIRNGFAGLKFIKYKNISINIFIFRSNGRYEIDDTYYRFER